MAGEIDAFDRLQLEHRRTIFALYGWRHADGSPGRAYFKLAESLSEALADLGANPGVDDDIYFVRDAFLETGEGREDPVVHVELVGLSKIIDEVGRDATE